MITPHPLFSTGSSHTHISSYIFERHILYIFMKQTPFESKNLHFVLLLVIFSPTLLACFLSPLLIQMFRLATILVIQSLPIHSFHTRSQHQIQLLRSLRQCHVNVPLLSH